jgi:hypothetical protein
MLIGGSVGGRYSRPIAGITAYENRILQNDEHSYFWQDSAYCIDNNIYLIVNIDSYLTNSRWYPTNLELRNFVIETKVRLKEFGATKYNCRFTVDNEADEYADFDYYMNMIRVIHDALNFDFYLGAGNFRTQSWEWYEHLAQQYIGGYYEILDIHMQDGLNEATDISMFVQWIDYIKNAYKIKRVAVTEGNNFYNVNTLHGHNMLKCQINYADYIGAEMFCFPYVNWDSNMHESHEGMAYCINGNPVSDYWQDMLNFIASKKPIFEEYDDMKLELLGLNYTKEGQQVKWLQDILLNDYKVPNPYGIDGKLGKATDQQIRDYQEEYNLKIDGIVGEQTTMKLINESSDPKKWYRNLMIYMYFEL